MCGACGFSLAELLVVVAVAAVVALLVYPAILQATARLRVELAAAELVAVLRQARAEATRRGCYVGVRFDTEENGRVTWALYRDGNGNGIRNAEIASGIDPRIGPHRRLTHLGRGVGFGFPPGIVPRDPGDPRRRLDRLDEPIRFGRSDIASFGPLGTSSPGSLYFTDGRRELAVVRVFHRTGKVKVLRYDAEVEQWK
jgi:prepilin-type N-terminal cleavage/methylation domain-containing protein